MAHFITTNAVALVATLGGLLVISAGLLSVAITRRTRQRDAVRRLLQLADKEGRYACDAVTSRFVHDLNNIILVLSMEAERVDSSSQSEILLQVVDEGRDVVERCRAQMSSFEASSSNLCDELRVATRLLRDAGVSSVDVAFANTVPAVVMVTGSADDVHVLVLSMARVAGLGVDSDRLSLTVSKGRDAALPEDENDSGWVNVSASGPEMRAEDDAASIVLARIARRLSGEVVFPDAASGRRRLAVSLPVVDPQ